MLITRNIKICDMYSHSNKKISVIRNKITICNVHSKKKTSVFKVNTNSHVYSSTFLAKNSEVFR